METANQNELLTGTFLDSQYFNPAYLFNQGQMYLHQLVANFTSPEAVSTEKTILFFLAMFFLIIISYTAVRMLEIRRKEHAHLHHEIEEYKHHQAQHARHAHEQTGGSKNEHWAKVISFIFSQHASDWKLAIIEADSMLFDLMNQMGFAGETLGDKLKSANQVNFPNLTIAWEAHAVRNRIAHEGLVFEVTQHEAKRVIAIYEEIFRAYGYI